MKIGVFDSGMGGESVAIAIRAALPHLEVIVREDKENVPYGSKTPEQLRGLTEPILQEMVDVGCRMIVVACNTVSTTIIEQLRKKISVPLIAVEPMVKPASETTKSKVIAVCATPATLKSGRYEWLKREYASDVTVLEPDCSRWSLMIESSNLDVRAIAESVNEVLYQGADVVVLGCTHYHWIEHEIRVLCDNRAIVMQPEPAIIEQLKRVLKQLP